MDKCFLCGKEIKKEDGFYNVCGTFVCRECWENTNRKEEVKKEK